MGPPVKRPHKGPLCSMSHSLLLTGSCPWQHSSSGVCWELSRAWLMFHLFPLCWEDCPAWVFLALLGRHRRIFRWIDKQPCSYSLLRPFFVSSDRGNILTEMTQHTTMPSFHVLHTLGLLKAPNFHSEKLLFLFYFFLSCLPAASSVLCTVFWLSDASVSFLPGVICVLRDILSLGWPVLRDAWFSCQCLWTLCPRTISLKWLNQEETGDYWLLPRVFSFSTPTAFLFWCRAEDLV